jgi:hypothetical protein
MSETYASQPVEIERGGSDFMAFRRMVTPVVIQALFVLGCVGSVIAGAVIVIAGIRHHHARDALIGVGVLILGPLVVRIYAEVLIVVFRINETLTDLRALAIWTAEREYGYESEEREDESID